LTDACYRCGGPTTPCSCGCGGQMCGGAPDYNCGNAPVRGRRLEGWSPRPAPSLVGEEPEEEAEAQESLTAFLG
jgi:hypothetical protein